MVDLFAFLGRSKWHVVFPYRMHFLLFYNPELT